MSSAAWAQTVAMDLLASGTQLALSDSPLNAVDVLSRALRSGGLGAADQARAVLTRGQAKMRGGQYANAVGDFNHVFWLNALPPSETATAYFYRGEALAKLSENVEAAQNFGATLALRPGDTPAMFNRGVSLLKVGNATEADTLFQQVIDANDDLSPIAQYARSIMAGAEGDVDAALVYAESALAMDPTFEEAADFMLELRGNSGDLLGVDSLLLARDYVPDLVSPTSDGGLRGTSDAIIARVSDEVSEVEAEADEPNTDLPTLADLKEAEETEGGAEADASARPTSRVAADPADIAAALERRAERAAQDRTAAASDAKAQKKVPSPIARNVTQRGSTKSDIAPKSRASSATLNRRGENGQASTYIPRLIPGEVAAAQALRRDNRLTALQAARIGRTVVQERRRLQGTRTMAILGHYATDEDARAGWRRALVQHPTLVDGITPVYTEFSQRGSNGASIDVVRLAVGPFASAMTARSFCVNVSRQGSPCSLQANVGLRTR